MWQYGEGGGENCIHIWRQLISVHVSLETSGW
jgi:hypothetical protein